MLTSGGIGGREPCELATALRGCGVAPPASKSTKEVYDVTGRSLLGTAPCVRWAVLPALMPEALLAARGLPEPAHAASVLEKAVAPAYQGGAARLAS